MSVAVSVEGVCDGRTDGSTGKKVIELREKTKGLVKGKYHWRKT